MRKASTTNKTTKSSKHDLHKNGNNTKKDKNNTETRPKNTNNVETTTTEGNSRSITSK